MGEHRVDFVINAALGLVQEGKEGFLPVLADEFIGVLAVCNVHDAAFKAHGKGNGNGPHGCIASGVIAVKAEDDFRCDAL